MAAVTASFAGSFIALLALQRGRRSMAAVTRLVSEADADADPGFNGAAARWRR